VRCSLVLEDRVGAVPLSQVQDHETVGSRGSLLQGAYPARPESGGGEGCRLVARSYAGDEGGLEDVM
jgi:hypothetical protein